MPVEFLSDEQAARYGRYQTDLSPEQLARFFYLSPQDLQFLADYRRAYTQLGCAVQLWVLLNKQGKTSDSGTQLPNFRD